MAEFEQTPAQIADLMRQFHARMDALLSANQQRLIALEEWRANGESLLRRDN